MAHDRDGANDLGFPSARATCARLREVAWSYLDDESPWLERQWIRAHLRECQACRAYVRFLRAFLRALRAELSREHTDDTLRRRIRALLKVDPESPA
jgi:predicted anti-sigma-YlaC factor YlaD